MKVLTPRYDNYPFDIDQCAPLPKPDEEKKKKGGKGWIAAIVVPGFLVLCICFCSCPCIPRSKLPAGSEAVAPADDGWGPYKCILAVRDGGRELIPGKLATARNVAFYSCGGKEH